MSDPTMNVIKRNSPSPGRGLVFNIDGTSLTSVEFESVYKHNTWLTDNVIIMIAYSNVVDLHNNILNQGKKRNFIANPRAAPRLSIQSGASISRSRAGLLPGSQTTLTSSSFRTTSLAPTGSVRLPTSPRRPSVWSRLSRQSISCAARVQDAV